MHFIVTKSIVLTNSMGTILIETTISMANTHLLRCSPLFDDVEIDRFFSVDAKYTNRHALIMLIAMCICDDKLNDWNENKRKKNKYKKI